MTAVAATLGGLKLSEKIGYDRKIARYKQIAKGFGKFNLGKHSNGGRYYLPLYTDDTAWQTTHKNKDSSETSKREKFLKENPTWQDFRDSCYKEAEKNTDCNLTDSWCVECARNTGWTLEKKRGVIKE